MTVSLPVDGSFCYSEPSDEQSEPEAMQMKTDFFDANPSKIRFLIVEIRM